MDVEALAALRLPPDVEREVEAAMRDFLHFSLERDARSLPFLDEVRRRRRESPLPLKHGAESRAGALSDREAPQ
jgi:hypothetical protein